MGIRLMYIIMLVWTFVITVDFSSQQLSNQEAKPYRVNISAATQAELCLLPRIVEKAAAKIIELRDEKGIHSVEDLLLVRGLNEKSIEELLPLRTWGETAP